MVDYDKENRSNEGGGGYYRDNYKEDRHRNHGNNGGYPPRERESGGGYRRFDHGRSRDEHDYGRRDREYSNYHHDRRQRDDRDHPRRRSRSRSRERQQPQQHPRCRDHGGDPRRTTQPNHHLRADKRNWPEYRVAEQRPDARLGDAAGDDPRGDDPTKRITQKAQRRGHGRNTESFDPASTLVRPDLRIHVGSNRTKTFHRVLKHDDVVIVPELFGAEDDWDTYYRLIEEMREIQSKENGDKKKSAEWVSWAEGAHLLTKNPEGSPTFNKIIDRLCEYFNIQRRSVGTRFNWYRDSADWKPFHHDSAAFNPHRARNQNITVGASFGSLRELAFLHATERVDGDKTRLYFPQANNGVFSFGRDANIVWKHGINALAPEEQDGKGRISIILWGLAKDVVEEDGSPPLLGADGRGPHAGGGGRGHGHHRHRGGRNDDQGHRDRNGGRGGR